MKILEAAIPVFADKGLNGASIRLVGEAAQVNSALIYYYFENKENLFSEAVRVVVHGLLEKLQAEERDLGSARERIACLVNGLMDYYSAHPSRTRLMGVVHSLYPQTLAKVLESLATTKRLVPLEILVQGMALGQLKPANPLQTWWSILGSCLFTLSMSEVARHVDATKLPIQVPTMEENRRQIISTFLEGLAVTPRTESKAKRQN